VDQIGRYIAYASITLLLYIGLVARSGAPGHGARPPARGYHRRYHARSRRQATPNGYQSRSV